MPTHTILAMVHRPKVATALLIATLDVARPSLLDAAHFIQHDGDHYPWCLDKAQKVLKGAKVDRCFVWGALLPSQEKALHRRFPGVVLWTIAPDQLTPEDRLPPPPDPLLRPLAEMPEFGHDLWRLWSTVIGLYEQESTPRLTAYELL